MARSVTFEPGEWYHCYNRGIDRRKTYMDRQDYQRFQTLLYASNSDTPFPLRRFRSHEGRLDLHDLYTEERGEPQVDIGAYALLPDQYHLLLRERTVGGITSFMQRLNTRYVMYFNIRHERMGPLFGGRFRAKQVRTSNLSKVVNFIHGNSAELFEENFKSGMVADKHLLKKSVRTYEFSSLCDYEEYDRPERVILSIESLKTCLGSSPTLDGALTDFMTVYARTNNPLWSYG